MQVKKYEAPTIQEALDHIKRDLGPEAIILQTKSNKKRFGLLSKPSVEVTVAVSERALGKKKAVEKKLTPALREAYQKLPATQQARVNEKIEATDPLTATAGRVRDQVQLKSQSTRKYADILDEGARAPAPARAAVAGSIPRMRQDFSENTESLRRIAEDTRKPQTAELLDSSGAQALLKTQALSTPALQEAFEFLLVAGVDKKIAFALLQKASFSLGEAATRDAEQVMDQIAQELIDHTEVSSLLESSRKNETGRDPMLLALVGPTGVGKTTTLAKIASLAQIKRGLKVGLINFDSYKVAAFDQLATYAQILQVPFRSVANADELKIAISDLQSMDLILIDTTGRSQKDQESLREMSAALDTIPGVRRELVLSATTRDTELHDMGRRFGIFRPEGLIFSKLDEAMTCGAILNLTHKLKLPLIAFTTGQRVPEDIEDATAERLTALILDL
jgi:flagellar biosynthesis protein FlhF